MADISAAMVKSLRDRTGAGMMDCKNALVETSGNEDAAMEIIQKKGLAKAAKKAGAIAAEGVIHAYIHPGSRLGVLVEINCQTDFVARNEEFKTLVDDVALQIASMNPLFVRRDEISAETVEKQREIFRAQVEEEDRNKGKARPADIVLKSVEGKVAKWIEESCLEEQVSVRDGGDKTFKQITEELTAKIGEKIAIRRFVRFELGEGIEKRKTDLAAEVAETLAAAAS